MNLVKYLHGITSENEDLPLYLWEAYIYLLSLKSSDDIDNFKRFGLDQLNKHLTTS